MARRRKAETTERARTADLGAPRRGSGRRAAGDPDGPDHDRLDERERRVRRRRKQPGPEASPERSADDASETAPAPPTIAPTDPVPPPMDGR
jgi:hypothetical protein